MPTNPEIKVFLIARTAVDHGAVRQWLDHIGADEFEIPEGEDDPTFLVALAAKRCYMSFQPGLNPNVTKIRKDMVEYFDNLLASRHGSVFEHSVFSFAIEGVTRVFTAEMNRHRAGWAISEGSLRFIRFDQNIPFWMPDSLQDAPGDDDDLLLRKSESRKLFMWAFRHQEIIYEQLMGLWNMNDKDKNFAYKKKVTSALRRIVGMGVSTGGVWTGNVRALRHVIAARTDPAAEEEIHHVFMGIGKHMMDHYSRMFGDFTGWPDSLVPQHPKV